MSKADRERIRTAPLAEIESSALDAVVGGTTPPQVKRSTGDAWRRQHDVAGVVATAPVGLPEQIGGG